MLHFSLLSDRQELSKLLDVFKLLLTLSHCQSAVERGFSINKDMLIENLHEETLVAQRLVHDNLSGNDKDYSAMPFTKKL